MSSPSGPAVEPNTCQLHHLWGRCACSRPSFGHRNPDMRAGASQHHRPNARPVCGARVPDITAGQAIVVVFRTNTTATPTRTIPGSRAAQEKPRGCCLLRRRSRVRVLLGLDRRDRQRGELLVREFAQLVDQQFAAPLEFGYDPVEGLLRQSMQIRNRCRIRELIGIQVQLVIMSMQSGRAPHIEQPIRLPATTFGCVPVHHALFED